MESRLGVMRVTEGDAPAMHMYFDVCPESPRAEKVVYFRFLEGPPGRGRVMVASCDGAGRRPVSEEQWGNAHVGVFQQWVDDDRVAYTTRTSSGVTTTVTSVSGGSGRELPVAVRMFSPDGKKALAASQQMRSFGAEREEEGVYLVDVESGDVRLLFTRDDVLAIHPLREEMTRLDLLTFKHTKWSPDGRRFFCVFANEPHARRMPELRRVKSIFVADADGSGLRYMKEFGHHPVWGRDGTFVYSHDRDVAKRAGQSLVAHPIDGGPPRIIWEDAPGVHASFSPDGAKVVTDVYRRAQGEGAIVLLDVKSGGEEELVGMQLPDTTHETGCHPHPVWSRDGSRVYFNSTDCGTAQLYAIDL